VSLNRALPFILIGFAALTSQARTARTFETINSTLITKGLAHSCLALKILPDGLPCNPAMTSLRDRRSLRAQVLVSDGYNSIKNLQRIVDGEVTQEMVDGFFSNERTFQIDASTDLMYRSQEMNVQLTPLAIRGFAEIRNESSPDIDLFTVEEKGLRFQTGYQFSEEFLLGFQVRVLNRKVISQHFNLFDLGTEAGQKILEPTQQSILYLEPGATFLLGQEWSPRISLMLANLGYVSRRNPGVPASVEPQVGFGISPPVLEGTLDLLVDYSSLSFQEQGADRLHLGALYHVNEFYYSAGIDAHGTSGGIHYEHRHFNLGLLFSTTRTLKEKETLDSHNLYFQIGLEI
jgi:hypothetical protein